MEEGVASFMKQGWNTCSMLGDYGNMVIVREKTEDLLKLHGELESRLLSSRVVMQTRCRDGVMI